jgi:hypothetical protein
MGVAAAYNHETKSPIRGGVEENDGNYSLDVTYYTPLNTSELEALGRSFENETTMLSRVLLTNETTKTLMQWSFYFPSTGSIGRNGRVFLHSTVDLHGPKGLWEVNEYLGTEVITQTPYLKWSSPPPFYYTTKFINLPDTKIVFLI